jgi:hypothetical protein
MQIVSIVVPIVVVVILLLILGRSLRSIGPREIGLVTKLIGRKLPQDNPIALHGEAGYQADLLMPGPATRPTAVRGIRSEPVPCPSGIGPHVGGPARRSGRHQSLRGSGHGGYIRCRGDLQSSSGEPATRTGASRRATRRAAFVGCLGERLQRASPMALPILAL